MVDKLKIDPKYFELIGEVVAWYKNDLKTEKRYLEAEEHKRPLEINRVDMTQGVISQIDGRWLQAMPSREDFQPSRDQIHYLKEAVETGIVNDDICPLDTVQLQELLEYLESIIF